MSTDVITVDRYEEVCGACPTIYDIYLSNGRKLYFRLRHGTARICDDNTEEVLWTMSMPHHDGFCTLTEMEQLLFKHVLIPMNLKVQEEENSEMFRSIKCTHSWKEITRRFTPPLTRHFTAKNANSDDTLDLIAQLSFGFTTIEQKCVNCGALNFVDAIGDQTDGEDL